MAGVAVGILLTPLTGSLFWKVTGYDFVNYDTYSGCDRILGEIISTAD